MFKKAHRYMSLDERFIMNVLKQSSGCWLWTGYRDKDGYGKIGVNGKRTAASRASWFIHFGDIPNGMIVCHKCDTPACVNPDHLFLGSVQDNNKDRDNKGRTFRGKREYIGDVKKGQDHHWHTKPESRLTGSKNGRSKLTVEIVELLKVEHSQGSTYEALARKYNVSGVAVRNAILGKTWRNNAQAS